MTSMHFYALKFDSIFNQQETRAHAAGPHSNTPQVRYPYEDEVTFPATRRRIVLRSQRYWTPFGRL